MNTSGRLLCSLAFLIFGALGCEHTTSPDTQPSQPPAANLSAKQPPDPQPGQATEQLTTKPTTPKPLISLATPPGWIRSDPRPLPTDDHGFTVAFEHESGLAVTLYQFTRGYTDIPNNLNAPLIKQELANAKDGIEQAVKLGYWQNAKEIAHGTVLLGDSKQRALWSQYLITDDGLTLASDIYIWSNQNTFFKLRCTARKQNAKSNQQTLNPLLTSLGSNNEQ